MVKIKSHMALGCNVFVAHSLGRLSASTTDFFALVPAAIHIIIGHSHRPGISLNSAKGVVDVVKRAFWRMTIEPLTRWLVPIEARYIPSLLPPLVASPSMGSSGIVNPSNQHIEPSKANYLPIVHKISHEISRGVTLVTDKINYMFTPVSIGGAK